MVSKNNRTGLHSAAYLLLERNDQILMLRRYNTGYKDGYYSFVAGHIEPGESATDAIIREAAEEAGILLSPADLEFAQVVHRRCEDGLIYYDLFFRATEWKGNITNVEPHKCDDLRWFLLAQLPEKTIPYIRKVINNIYTNNEAYLEIGWANPPYPQVTSPNKGVEL